MQKLSLSDDKRSIYIYLYISNAQAYNYNRILKPKIRSSIIIIIINFAFHLPAK